MTIFANRQKTFRPISDYPGEAKACPNTLSRNWGLPPLYQEGGSVCVQSADKKKSRFFGPNMKVPVMYAKCKMVKRKRFNKFNNITWTSAADINDGAFLDWNQHFNSYHYSEEARLHRIGAFSSVGAPDEYATDNAKANVYSRSLTAVNDVRILVTDCKMQNATSEQNIKSNTYVFTTYDFISNKERNVVCKFPSGTFHKSAETERNWRCIIQRFAM